MRKEHRLHIHVLNVRGENTSLHVRTTCNQQSIIRVPVDGKDGGFLRELRDPPAALLVKGADRHGSGNNRSRLENATVPFFTPSSAGNSKFVLKRALADEDSGTIDIQQHKSLLSLQPTSF